MDVSGRYQRIAADFARELRLRAKDSIQDILLYGSVARGEATERSDIDVLVVYAKQSPEARGIPTEVAAEMMQRHDALVSVLECDPDEYERLLRFPFGWRVRKDAVRL